VTNQRVDGCENRENGHGAGKAEADEAKAPMNIDASSGDQQSLCDEQKDPASEDCAMNVNQSVGKRRLKNTGQVIGASETDEDGEENQESHAREKETVVAASRRRRWYVGGLNNGGCQGPSKH